MRDQRQRSGGPASGLLKGAGFLIGLGTELHAHSKALKLSGHAIQSQETTGDHSQAVSCPTVALIPPTYEVATIPRPSIDATLQESNASAVCNEKLLFVANDNPMPVAPLPLPVILPQRRPNDKTRGFLRAYAPDLGIYKGIDEATFLNFLEEFHKSSQASGWFTVLNVAAMGAGFSPSLIALAVTTSVQIGSTAAAEAQRRYRTNSYLDNANEQLFHPKNLHCMVMAFKPDASDTTVLNVGMDSKQPVPIPPSPFMTVLSEIRRHSNSVVTTNSSTGLSRSGKFRKYDGMTEGELALPQAASLVMQTAPSPPGRSPSPQPLNNNDYGNDDDKERPNHPQKPEGAWKSTVAFMSDYKDRRAQAKYAATQSNSKLAVVGATDSARFASRFSDPNANPFDFMRRGKSDSGDRDRRRRDWDDEEGRGDGDDPCNECRGDQRERSSDDRHRQSSCGDAREKKGLLGGVKSMLQQDFLYLLIAEIPEEVADQSHRGDRLDDDLQELHENREKMYI